MYLWRILLHTCKLRVLRDRPCTLASCICKNLSLRSIMLHFFRNSQTKANFNSNLNISYKTRWGKKNINFCWLVFQSLHVINDFCPEHIAFLQSLENNGRQLVVILFHFRNLVVPEFESFFVCSVNILRKIKSFRS